MVSRLRSDSALSPVADRSPASRHLRAPAQIVVILVDPAAVAVEPAAHGAQEGLQIASDMVIEPLPRLCREQRRVAGRARLAARVGFGRPPLHIARQQLAKPADNVVVENRAGPGIEAEPNQPLAPFVGNGSIAKGEQQAAGPGGLGVTQAPDRVGQIERAIQPALGVARRCDGGREDKLALGEAAAVAEHGAEPVEPVALEPDRRRPRW